jgi:hypothetical protein
MVYLASKFGVLNGLYYVLSLFDGLSFLSFLLSLLCIDFLSLLFFEPCWVVFHPQILLHFPLVLVQNESMDLLLIKLLDAVISFLTDFLLLAFLFLEDIFSIVTHILRSLVALLFVSLSGLLKLLLYTSHLLR